MRPLRPLLAVFAVVAIYVVPAEAVEIKEVKSKGGITAWLVEDHTNPLIAMQFSFQGGAANDPKGKEGTAHFITAMMDEGAGDLDSEAFQAKRDDLAMKMSFDANFDQFQGSFQTLSAKRDESLALLKLAMTKPRFDKDPMDRVRDQLLIGARQNAEEPESISSSAWMVKAFGDHPYARESEGTVTSLATITQDDLRAMHKQLFSRKGLKVAVVGDIKAEDLAKLLDDTFGDLPDSEPPKPPAMVHAADKASIEVIDRDIPQSIITFGHDGILRADPNFIPAYVTSFILGGGGFGSRLTDEVREKRGLTYGVSLSLYPFDRAGLVFGQLGTRNDKAGEALTVVKETMKKFAEEGPTAEELAETKTYLTGSYDLRFDSNSKIASQLLAIQQDNLGIDYINRRNEMVNAVTLEEAKAQAKSISDTDKLIVTVVGKPVGITPTAP
ncbi:insulinase family protein [Nordella sp. HKS 07]|uniref:M16 family metallopeptidase n=1 Tax=Nordella sp. HKS 07 TaxID=2712222 RepID=UPI0013E0F4B6|nr:pitrilysin family protein [Nordella sp. HKS 07]QIG50115.1 insulinase family protein [Nordella sp. HKS 07]